MLIWLVWFNPIHSTLLNEGVSRTHACSGKSCFPDTRVLGKRSNHGHACARETHVTPGYTFNPLNAELNPICHLVALLRVHHFLHVSRMRVKSLTLRLLMSYIYIHIYIYGAPILGVSRSHTTTHHSR